MGDPQIAVLECNHVWKVFGTGIENLSRTTDAVKFASRVSAMKLVPAVRDVSLEVSRGEIFCVMGLSGSGKSTLVRCMAGLTPLTRGNITLLGMDVGGCSADQLRKLRRESVSMVFQDFALLPHMTVLENVAFPLRVRGKSRSEREAAAQEMVNLVGLSGRESYYPHELSGGQQQRVGIARSLTTNPEVWFLDEPFSALDPLIRQDMQDELLRLQSLLHKSIVFITHDFDEAIRLATRIGIMRDGTVIQIASPENLVLHPADDYVARFTSKVALADVVRVSTIMGPPMGQFDLEPLQSNSLVRHIAARVLDSGRAVPVVEGDRTVGSVAPAAVIDILTQRFTSARK